MTPEAATPNTATPDTTDGRAPFLRLTHVFKRYGRTQALDDAELVVLPGEVLGLVGHNGAGKSTLMRTVVGITKPDQGSIELDGHEVEGHSLETARASGIRIVFQELSLSPDLRVFENVVVGSEQLRDRHWRTHARERISAQLDEVFPRHGISPWARIESLTLSQRQMVEIAQATLPEGDPRLVILDEPTSALDREAAGRLFEFIAARRDEGMSFILISHRISEILEHTDRIAVMRDGKVVATRTSSEVTEDDLVTLMGGTAGSTRKEVSQRAHDGEIALDVQELQTRKLHDISLKIGRGEVVGLAGLEGQGQQELLLELWHRRARRGSGGVRQAARMAFVTGDRQESGVFPLWPLSLNISIGALRRVLRHGVVDPGKERRLTSDWLERLKIRGESRSEILDLSGGNQQKVLIARAMAAAAEVILLDDPFRGVDISTRQDTYRLIRQEASEQGRSFLWFSTENGELEQCDRVYVLSEGAIVAELEGEEITEERVIAASFSRREARSDGAAPAAEGASA